MSLGVSLTTVFERNRKVLESLPVLDNLRNPLNPLGLRDFRRKDTEKRYGRVIIKTGEDLEHTTIIKV